MKTTVSGSLTREEVDQIVKEHVEKATGKKVASLRARVGGHEDPTDWRGEYPLSHELDAYDFTLSEEEVK